MKKTSTVLYTFEDKEGYAETYQKEYFDIELTADNLKSSAPESNIAPENYYDISESEYILLDENENEIISGNMDDIRNYIEDKF